MKSRLNSSFNGTCQNFDTSMLQPFIPNELRGHLLKYEKASRRLPYLLVLYRFLCAVPSFCEYRQDYISLVTKLYELLTSPIPHTYLEDEKSAEVTGGALKKFQVLQVSGED